MTNCTKCEQNQVTIRMRIAGRDIVFHSCSGCEAKTWHDESGSIPLTRVLELARTGANQARCNGPLRPPAQRIEARGA
jgi:hypothetical protein